MPSEDSSDAAVLPPDADEDGVADADDNCPNGYNPEQIDTDRDGYTSATNRPTHRWSWAMRTPALVRLAAPQQDSSILTKMA